MKGCPRVEAMWGNKHKEEPDLGDQWNVRVEEKQGWEGDSEVYSLKHWVSGDAINQDKEHMVGE